jgi:hypothetical protein
LLKFIVKVVTLLQISFNHVPDVDMFKKPGQLLRGLFGFLSLLTIVPQGFSQSRSVIYAERIVPAGKVIYTSSLVISKTMVDGFVKVVGSNKFIFPVGDNGVFRPFAAAADGTAGAYYNANPSIAITSNPKGGNYGVLPKDGPFSTSKKGAGVGTVSSKEYWDINGTIATKLTLTWNKQTAVGSMLNGAPLSKLYIVGWNGTSWIKIASTFDVTSLFGSASSLDSGSVTTISTLIPNSFSVYTLGADPATSPSTARMANFSAKPDEIAVDLTWNNIDAGEDFDKYFIEKSADGINWKNVASVDHSNSSGRYSYLDRPPLTGKITYRLSSNNKNLISSYDYTSVERENEIFSLFPNPASDRFYVSSTNLFNVRSLSILDKAGKQLVKMTSITDKGIETLNLPPGIYIIAIETKNGSLSTHKLVIK